MLQSIEALEDAIVLMREALVPHPSDQVPIIPENAVESAIKSKKEKKSRRTRLSSTIRLYDERISKAYFYACLLQSVMLHHQI